MDSTTEVLLETASDTGLKKIYGHRPSMSIFRLNIGLHCLAINISYD
jgi:hypothetical protein